LRRDRDAHDCGHERTRAAADLRNPGRGSCIQGNELLIRAGNATQVEVRLGPP